MDRIIYTDVDGVLLNWTGRFIRWVHDNGHEYKSGGIRLKSPIVDFNFHASLDITPELLETLIAEFNCHDHFSFLPPQADAIKYTRKLHEEYGYTFTAITSIGSSGSRKGRWDNINLYYKNIVTDIIFVNNKRQSLEAVFKEERTLHDSPVFWIEDNYDNAMYGHNIGFHTILLDKPYNRINKNLPKFRVNKWKDIYDIVEHFNR